MVITAQKTRKQKIEDMTPKGPQTYQIGDKMVSKEEFNAAVSSEKQRLADQRTPDSSPGIPPFADASLKAKIEANVPQTPGRTAEQFQQQTIQQQTAQEQPATARDMGQTGVVSKDLQKVLLPNLPVVGTNVAAITSEVLFKKIESGQGLTQEDVAMISQLKLNDLDIAQIKAGKAHISRLGELVDNVPLLGHKKRIGGVSIGITDFVTETPSSNINKLLDSMEASKTNIVNWAGEIKINPQKAPTYLPLIEAQEQEILNLESRIKLMSLQQQKVQANPEIYDNIQKEINDILTKTGNAKTDLQMLGIR